MIYSFCVETFPKEFRGDSSNCVPVLWKVSPGKKNSFCHFFFNKESIVRSLFFSRCSVGLEGTEAQGIRLLYDFFLFHFHNKNSLHYFLLYIYEENKFEPKQFQSQCKAWLLHHTCIHQPQKKGPVAPGIQY